MRIVWTEEEYGTGFPEIDGQHQELFERINGLLAACEAGRPKREVDLLLQFLSLYAVRHFVCEERVMAEHDCRSCKANRDGHRWFAERFAELKGRYRTEGVTDALVADLRSLLLGWVDSHIRKVDRALIEVAEPLSPG